jgi:DNA-binding response OmpR family regulator
MPVLDGLAATRALRASGLRLPVVGLTATVLDDVRQQAHDAGLDAVMAKPIEAGQLQALLARLLDPAGPAEPEAAGAGLAPLSVQNGAAAPQSGSSEERARG